MSVVQRRPDETVEILRPDFEPRWACVVEEKNPDSMDAGTCTSETVAVPGARVGDPAVAGHDQLGAVNVLISAHVQAAAVVRVVFLNCTAGVVNIANGNLFVAVRVRY